MEFVALDFSLCSQMNSKKPTTRALVMDSLWTRLHRISAMIRCPVKSMYSLCAMTYKSDFRFTSVTHTYIYIHMYMYMYICNVYVYVYVYVYV